MQKTPDFDAELRPYTLYKEFLWQSKGMQKTPDFDANQGNLLMNVVMIYFYSKRFRFAPSFNNSQRCAIRRYLF